MPGAGVAEYISFQVVYPLSELSVLDILAVYGYTFCRAFTVLLENKWFLRPRREDAAAPAPPPLQQTSLAPWSESRVSAPSLVTEWTSSSQLKGLGKYIFDHLTLIGGEACWIDGYGCESLTT